MNWQKCYLIFNKMQKILNAFLFLVILLLTSSCYRHHSYLGYVEGRLTYIASPIGGKLAVLSVNRGQLVKTGDALFQLEQQPQSSDVSAALATVNQINADLADRMKGGRPSELDAISAQIQGAEAQVEYAKKDVARKQQLVSKNALEQNQLDLANENLKIAESNVALFKANLTTANLPGRDEQIKALQSQLDNAKANLERAQWNYQQKTVTSSVNARIFDIYYRVGEEVPGNQAVLSILAPADIKVIFYVDEASLSKIKVGQVVRITCDGCHSHIDATIHFISPSSEFTPPIIYSRSARSKLVYEVEAVFDHNKAQRKGVPLNPGQPVEVTI